MSDEGRIPVDPPQPEALEWAADLPAALQRAQAERKVVLVDFSKGH